MHTLPKKKCSAVCNDQEENFCILHEYKSVPHASSARNPPGGENSEIPKMSGEAEADGWLWDR